MSNIKNCIMSNGIGSIEAYEKNKFTHGKGDNKGHKEKKPETKYRVRYRYIDEFGKSRQTSKSNFDFNAAKAFLNERTYEISKGDYIHKKDITVNEFADGWFSEYSAGVYRQNTVDWHRYNIEHIKRGLGNIQMQHLGVKDIRRFYTSLLNQDHLSSTYISNINRTLKQILDSAVNSEPRCIKKNPCRDKAIKDLVALIRDNYESECEPVVIRQRDLFRLIEHLKDQPGGISIALGGLMGLRVGEVRGLRWSDIDFNKKILTVRHQLTRHCGKEYELTKPKTKYSCRPLKLSTYMIEFLIGEQQKQRRLEKIYGKEKFSLGFVCVHTNNEKLMGKPFAHNYYNTLLNKGLCDMELDKMRFHDLRHSFGSNLLYQNIPIHTVSRLMRHSNIAITCEIYDKTNKDQDDELFDNVIEVNLNNIAAEIKDTENNSMKVVPMEPINERTFSSPRLKRNSYKAPQAYTQSLLD